MADEKKQVHYCNTCKHIQKPMTAEPCKDCVPAKFGGPDRWEPKYTREDIAEIRAEQEIAYRRDNGL